MSFVVHSLDAVRDSLLLRRSREDDADVRAHGGGVSGRRRPRPPSPTLTHHTCPSTTIRSTAPALDALLRRCRRNDRGDNDDGPEPPRSDDWYSAECLGLAEEVLASRAAELAALAGPSRDENDETEYVFGVAVVRRIGRTDGPEKDCIGGGSSLSEAGRRRLTPATGWRRRPPGGSSSPGDGGPPSSFFRPPDAAERDSEQSEKNRTVEERAADRVRALCSRLLLPPGDERGDNVVGACVDREQEDGVYSVEARRGALHLLALLPASPAFPTGGAVATSFRPPPASVDKQKDDAAPEWFRRATSSSTAAQVSREDGKLEGVAVRKREARPQIFGTRACGFGESDERSSFFSPRRSSAAGDELSGIEDGTALASRRRGALSSLPQCRSSSANADSVADDCMEEEKKLESPHRRPELPPPRSPQSHPTRGYLPSCSQSYAVRCSLLAMTGVPSPLYYPPAHSAGRVHSAPIMFLRPFRLSGMDDDSSDSLMNVCSPFAEAGAQCILLDSLCSASDTPHRNSPGEHTCPVRRALRSAVALRLSRYREAILGIKDGVDRIGGATRSASTLLHLLHATAPLQSELCIMALVAEKCLLPHPSEDGGSDGDRSDEALSGAEIVDWLHGKVAAEQMAAAPIVQIFGHGESGNGGDCPQQSIALLVLSELFVRCCDALLANVSRHLVVGSGGPSSTGGGGGVDSVAASLRRSFLTADPRRNADDLDLDGSSSDDDDEGGNDDGGEDLRSSLPSFLRNLAPRILRAGAYLDLLRASDAKTYRRVVIAASTALDGDTKEKEKLRGMGFLRVALERDAAARFSARSDDTARLLDDIARSWSTPPIAAGRDLSSVGAGVGGGGGGDDIVAVPTPESSAPGTAPEETDDDRTKVQDAVNGVAEAEAAAVTTEATNAPSEEADKEPSAALVEIDGDGSGRATPRVEDEVDDVPKGTENGLNRGETGAEEGLGASAAAPSEVDDANAGDGRGSPPRLADTVDSSKEELKSAAREALVQTYGRLADDADRRGRAAAWRRERIDRLPEARDELRELMAADDEEMAQQMAEKMMARGGISGASDEGGGTGEDANGTAVIADSGPGTSEDHRGADAPPSSGARGSPIRAESDSAAADGPVRRGDAGDNVEPSTPATSALLLAPETESAPGVPEKEGGASARADDTECAPGTGVGSGPASTDRPSNAVLVRPEAQTGGNAAANANESTPSSSVVAASLREDLSLAGKSSEDTGARAPSPCRQLASESVVVTASSSSDFDGVASRRNSRTSEENGTALATSVRHSMDDNGAAAQEPDIARTLDEDASMSGAALPVSSSWLNPRGEEALPSSARRWFHDPVDEKSGSNTLFVGSEEQGKCPPAASFFRDRNLPSSGSSVSPSRTAAAPLLLPIDVAADTILRRRILGRCGSLDRLVLAHFLRDGRFLEGLALLRMFYLGMGCYLPRFVGSLHSLAVEAAKEGDEWRTVEIVRKAHHLSLSLSGMRGKDFLLEEADFAYDIDDDCVWNSSPDPFSPVAFDCVVPHHRVPPPHDLVIDGSVLRKYARLQKLLLRQVHAEHLMSGAWTSLSRAERRRGNTRDSGAAARRRNLHLHRHEIQHVVAMVSQYLRLQLHGSWHRFQSELSSGDGYEGLHGLYGLHRSNLDRLLVATFHGGDWISERVRRHLDDLYAIVRDFCSKANTRTTMEQEEDACIRGNLPPDEDYAAVSRSRLTDLMRVFEQCLRMGSTSSSHCRELLLLIACRADVW